MATSATAASLEEQQLATTVHKLEVACSELKNLPATRTVYEKRGAIFFRTSSKAATRNQQNELEKAKARVKKQ